MAMKRTLFSKVRLKTLRFSRWKDWIKISLCVYLLLWAFLLTIFILQNADYSRRKSSQINTVILNIPFVGRVEVIENTTPNLMTDSMVTLRSLLKDVKFSRNSTIEQFTKSVRKTDIEANSIFGTPRTYVNGRPSYHIFNESFQTNDAYMKSWNSRRTTSCGGKFQGFANMFVRLTNVTVDSTKSRGASGGENISEVLRQRESSEFLNPKMGFYEMNCIFKPKYTFNRYNNWRGHLPTWVNTIKLNRYKPNVKQENVIKNFTVTIQRYDYANIYHSLNDIFNVFLLHIFFHKDPRNSVIVFADGHPKGPIDPLWEKMFGQIIRVRHLKSKILFTDMVWPMIEKFSPLNQFDLKQVSHIDHFRSYIFDQYGIPTKKAPNCNSVNVLFIWRHDYLSHPRNPKGKITRKISNEQEIYNSTKSAFSKVNFNAVDLANLSMREQLQLISNTDIIIGMHGAGLTLEVFLPPGGGVLEMLPRKPKNFLKKQYDLFKVITDRIPLHYIRWQNKNPKNEVGDGYTYIPPTIVVESLKEILNKVCP